ncbi:MAG: mechanosensitive ion channel [Erysipelotrichaceae bacterium]|nr:mechanosensitive ion channel [Erysipelotrichaceae bacterium]
MKELKKVIVSLVFLVIFFFRAKSIGFGFEELIANVNINLEAVLKVALIIAFLSVVKYLLKLLVSLIRFEWAATFVTITLSAIDYITLILMVVWSLRLLGADINGIIAGLGILALIIGTSAEGLIEDMLTGIFMLFEREFKVGDIIEVDGFLGKVIEIGIRTTTLIDGAGNIKIFNNSSMKDILNRSAHRSVAVVDITLPADTDLEQVTEADYGDIKCLGLQEIGSDEVSIRFVKETPEAELYNTIRDMNVVILKKLRELGLR